MHHDKNLIPVIHIQNIDLHHSLINLGHISDVYKRGMEKFIQFG